MELCPHPRDFLVDETPASTLLRAGYPRLGIGRQARGNG